MLDIWVIYSHMNYLILNILTMAIYKLISILADFLSRTAIGVMVHYVALEFVNMLES